MSLRDRLETIRNEPASVQIASRSQLGVDRKQYGELKTHIHQTLLDRVNLEAMEELPPQRLKDELKSRVERLLEE
jgi:pilus assembly protein CpaF